MTHTHSHISASPRTSLSYFHAFCIVAAALLIRALVMHFYIAPNEFYKQPDSVDYHAAALCIATGNGMHRIDNHEPIFWRTPGYPIFLSALYRVCGISNTTFEGNAHAQQTLIWIQIALSSLIPLLIFFLAILITHNYAIGIISAWITVFHPGFVLASTFLLTEGLALFFFYLFLIGVYAILQLRPRLHSVIRSGRTEKKHSHENEEASHINNPFVLSEQLNAAQRAKVKLQSKDLLLLIATALCLSAYTWMRPMGEFIALFTTVLIALCAPGSWKQSLTKSALFALIFFASLAPWYLRNYQLTNELFFCPTLGTYLNVFSAPKILRRTLKKPLLECHQILRQRASRETLFKMKLLHGTGKYVSNNICKLVAYPVIAQHPFYFAYDWLQENIKTTFDLYSYQLVSMANGSYFYDPLEEFLPDKIAACLYQEQLLPPLARTISWAELIFQLLLWIGIFAGFFKFVIHPTKLRRIWLISLSLIAVTIAMTGGFGYARLRLPVEPLLIILPLTYFCMKNRKGNS